MQLTSQGLRYLAVVCLGLAADLGLALVLAASGAPRGLASAFGLLCGAALNFVLHRAWTFRESRSGPVSRQVLSYAVSLGITLGVRLAVLAILRAVPVQIGDAIALLLATGVSFVVNFVLLRRLVFNRRVAP